MHLAHFQFLTQELYRYTLPSTLKTTPPLSSSDETLLGGYIRVTPFQPFEPPHPNPLQMNPPSDSLIRMDADMAISLLPPSTPRDRLSVISPVSSPDTDLSKQWPRPLDLSTTKRAGDWVKDKAAKRREKLDEEAKEGLGMEVLDGEVKFYEGGVEAGGLYMDGFSDLAVWMDVDQKHAVRATLDLL